MAKKYAVVLSDIHIGNDKPTCWYQSAVHEPYLTAALKWVVAKKEEISELVLLGDMFDVWTYPPSDQPPAMKDIIAANKTLFGKTGPFAAVVKALPGEVRLLLGNHDGTITKAHVDELNLSIGGDPAKGEEIKLVAAPYRVVTGARGARTVFTHGHHWCMFNAPDPKSPWATLPVGHFVTRALGYQMQKTLKKGQTVADLPNMGNPNGFDLEKFLDTWVPTLDPDIVTTLLDYVCGVTKMPQTEKIKMPDGSVSSVVDAKKIFKSLFTRWGEPRTLDKARAAMADQWGEHLAWFAQRLAMQNACDLVVMGHTHAPVGGLPVSPVNYFNSGYECVSKPDLKKKRFTFTVVDLELASAEVFEVSKTKTGFDVTVFAAPQISVIRPPGMDFSSYVRIENLGGKPLKLVGSPRATDSYWVIPPPPDIPHGKRADMWLQDNPGRKGSAGGFTYNDGTRNLDFAFSCPTGLSPNTVSSPIANYQTRAGSGKWRSGAVDALGHPLQVRFTVKAAIKPAVPPVQQQPPQGVMVA